MEPPKAWTLQQYRDNLLLFRQFTHRQSIPCVCGRCGATHTKSKRVVYLNLANTEQVHFFCSRSCSSQRQRDAIGEGRICRACQTWTPVAKLWHRQGWECNSCAAKHPHFRFRSYKARAVARKIAFTLTRPEFLTFWRKPCSYCGKAIETIGLDRVDNAKGYELGNVVPCCSRCNAIKGTEGVADFMARCRRISELHPC